MLYASMQYGHCTAWATASAIIDFSRADNAPSLKLAARVGYRLYADGTYKEGPVRLLERLRP